MRIHLPNPPVPVIKHDTVSGLALGQCFSDPKPYTLTARSASVKGLSVLPTGLFLPTPSTSFPNPLPHTKNPPPITKNLHFLNTIFSHSQQTSFSACHKWKAKAAYSTASEADTTSPQTCVIVTLMVLVMGSLRISLPILLSSKVILQQLLFSLIVNHPYANCEQIGN